MIILSTGTDPQAREQADIDVIAANPRKGQLLAGECKWRSTLNVSTTIDTLRSRSEVLHGFDSRHYALFVKTDELAAIARQRNEPNLLVRSASELFEVNDMKEDR